MVDLIAPPIAYGRTAEIYAWEDGRVLKLFYDWVSESGVRQEADITLAVRAAGLPVPAAYGVVQIGGRSGILFERVEGPSGLTLFQAKPWNLARISSTMGRLHAALHAVELPGLPSQRDRLAWRIREEARGLPGDLKAALLERLELLPAGSRVCHGDFHPDNILFKPGGAVVIDWIDATRGNPLADVARTKLLMLGASPPEETKNRWVLTLGRRAAYRVYERQYARLRPFDRRELDAWRPVIAAARMAEGIAKEQDWLLSIVREGLKG